MLWEELHPAERPVMSIGMHQVDGELPTGALEQHPPLLRDPRLLQITASGNLLVRDAATGAVTATRAGVAPSSHANYIAFGGRLYGYSLTEQTNRLRVSDVDGTGAPRDIFTGAPGHNITSLAACGAGRVCVLDIYDEAQVIAIDVDRGREAWRVGAPRDVELLTSAGARVLATGRSHELGTVSVLLDQDGRQVLRSDTQVVWLSSGTLLSFGATELAAVDAADGSVRVLGELPEHGRYCSWTERRVACPTATGFQVWDISPR
ncbi:hypothetical protein ACFQ1L_43315 [Phytohabitans flavus]|uniref:hypothetical protein n=1 Tax=Phytohabitans flavus TaxID=1076124 RepID=UPI00362E4D32